MNYRFHPEALLEYESAVAFYRDRSTQLAFRFVNAVETAVESIVQAPYRWRVIDEDVRRCLTRVFPYGVV